jgi:molybdopterin converting factor small subunit
MSVEVEISSVFRQYMDNQKTVTVECSNVGECLRELSRRYPQTKGMFMNEEGELLNRFEIYINGESIYPTGIATPLEDGDKVNLVYIIHGG